MLMVSKCLLICNFSRVQTTFWSGLHNLPAPALSLTQSVTKVREIFSRQTVEEIFSLFTLAGCGLLVFISFGPGARPLKLMNTYYPELDLELLAKHPLCSCLFYLYVIIQTEQ